MSDLPSKGALSYLYDGARSLGSHKTRKSTQTHSNKAGGVRYLNSQEKGKMRHPYEDPFEALSGSFKTSSVSHHNQRTIIVFSNFLG